MPQKKNKENAQKKLNLVRAQYKKEFFDKIQHFLNELCEEKLYHHIPANYLENLYENRSHPLRAIPAKGYKFPVILLERIKNALSFQLKDNKFVINKNGLEISVYDYITIFYSLLKYIITIKEDAFPGVETIKTKLLELIKNKVDEHFLQKLNNVLQGVISLNNTIGKCIYWTNYDRTGFDKVNGGIENIAYLYSYVPESISVEIKGIARPAVAFKWAMPQIGPEFMSIKPSLFNLKSPFAEIPMNIYIQNHALMRLAERIDCLYLGYVHFFMYVSFRDTRVYYDQNNNILIEYRIDNCKAGYFRVDIVDGILVVRTFLFITNNFTHEGQLLEKNTGLQKLDKKYLAIDKLSTFMTSDIGSNEVLRKVFNESGCHSLIELYEKADRFSTKHPSKFNVSFMVDYLTDNNNHFPDDI